MPAVDGNVAGKIVLQSDLHWPLLHSGVKHYDSRSGKVQMAETVDELTIQYEEDGQVLRKELNKEVLSKGSWATIMFLYQDLDRKSGDYGPQKISIRRYQKREGTYIQRSKFEISSANQAKSICKTIEEWIPQES